jgi:hypothetical protein
LRERRAVLADRLRRAFARFLRAALRCLAVAIDCSFSFPKRHPRRFGIIAGAERMRTQ